MWPPRELGSIVPLASPGRRSPFFFFLPFCVSQSLPAPPPFRARAPDTICVPVPLVFAPTPQVFFLHISFRPLDQESESLTVRSASFPRYQGLVTAPGSSSSLSNVYSNFPLDKPSLFPPSTSTHGSPADTQQRAPNCECPLSPSPARPARHT